MNNAQMIAALAALPDPDLVAAAPIDAPLGSRTYYQADTVVRLLAAQQRPTEAAPTSLTPPPEAATNAALERATKPEEWRAMVYAPLDGTKITMLIRHTTWWAAHKHDPAKANIWEAECEGHWIDFNGGGWTWAGMAGTPIGWRALKDEK